MRYDSDAAGRPIEYASSAFRTCSEARSTSEYTATAAISISWQARMTRTAISPRFAIRIFLNMLLDPALRTQSRSNRDIVNGIGPIVRSRFGRQMRWFKPRTCEFRISIMYLRGVTASATCQTTDSEPATKIHWLALLLVLFANVAVGLHCLSCKPFWFDESFSVEVARVDWRNFLHLMWWREANMSLYYVLLRFWLHFGQSPAWIRGLSVLIAASSVLAVYWVARLLFDRRVALMSAALLAFNAFDLRYSQEARSYALFVFLGRSLRRLLDLLASLSHSTQTSRVHRRKYSGDIRALLRMLLLAVQWMIVRWWRSPNQVAIEHRDKQTSPGLD